MNIISPWIARSHLCHWKSKVLNWSPVHCHKFFVAQLILRSEIIQRYLSHRQCLDFLLGPRLYLLEVKAEILSVHLSLFSTCCNFQIFVSYIKGLQSTHKKQDSEGISVLLLVRKQEPRACNGLKLSKLGYPSDLQLHSWRAGEPEDKMLCH